MNIVIDVNVALYYVMQQDKNIEEIIIASDVIITPALFISEAANALLQYTKKSLLEKELAIDYLNAAVAIIDNFVNTATDSDQIFDLALQHSLTYYDAEYLHLALKSNYKLLTFDKKLKEVANSLNLCIDNSL